MKMRQKLLFLLPVLLAGCTDDLESISREYRNANNEAIDALMKSTSEEQAKVMTGRVFKHMQNRYKAMDKKVEICIGGRSRADLVKETYSSNGVHLYFSELVINQQRFKLEEERLKNLVKQYVDRERELLIAQGDPNPQIDPQQLCPTLTGLNKYKDEIAEQLKGKIPCSLFEDDENFKEFWPAIKANFQDKEPELAKLMKGFPTWPSRSKVKDFDKLLAVFFAKRDAFRPPAIKLVSDRPGAARNTAYQLASAIGRGKKDESRP